MIAVFDNFIVDQSLLDEIKNDDTFFSDPGIYKYWKGWWTKEPNNTKQKLANYIFNENLPLRIDLPLDGFEYWTGLQEATGNHEEGVVFKDNLEHLLLKNDLAYYKDFNTPFDLFDCLGANDLYIPIHSFLVSKSIILRSGEWNENLKINQDGEYFSRVLINTKYIKFCKNTLVYYRRNEGDSVSVYKDSNLKDLIESWKLIEKQLKPHYKSKKIQYVKSAKNRILSFILEEHYWFVLKNFCFFKESILNKIKNKISQK
mgnify:CR=1 FL=1